MSLVFSRAARVTARVASRSSQAARVPDLRLRVRSRASPPTMRPNRRLHSRTLLFEHRVRVVLPARPRLSPRHTSRGFRLVLARAAFLARRPLAFRREEGHRRARGPSMRERDRRRARFHDAPVPLRRAGRRDAGRCLPPRSFERSRLWHLCRLLRCAPDRTRSDPHEGRRDRARAKAREKPPRFFDPRCLPSPGAASSARHARAWSCGLVAFVDRAALT